MFVTDRTSQPHRVRSQRSINTILVLVRLGLPSLVFGCYIPFEKTAMIKQHVMNLVKFVHDDVRFAIKRLGQVLTAHARTRRANR